MLSDFVISRARKTTLWTLENNRNNVRNMPYSITQTSSLCAMSDHIFAKLNREIVILTTKFSASKRFARRC